MINPEKTQFMIIDDSPMNNLICEKTIRLFSPDVSITAFTDPQVGLDYINSNYNTPFPIETVLLLDINMPVLSGWDVLERFKDFPDFIREQFKIYILTSSINVADKQKADNNPLVCGLLGKPITMTQLESMF